MSAKIDISFTLNGRKRQVSVDAGMSALTLLRDVFDLTGTKLACGEGECGACTVLVDGLSVNSCLMYAVDMEGRNVLTIEGLRTERGFDQMQDAFVEHGAIQCGFCMPGMIMQARYLANKNHKLTLDELKRGLEGNICRCTGYKKVFDAVAAVVGIGAQ